MHRASRCQELNAYNIVWVQCIPVRGGGRRARLLFTRGHVGERTPTNCLVLFVMRMRAVYVVNGLIMFVTRMQMAFTVVVMHVLVCVSLSRSCWTKRPVAVLILSYCGIKHAFGRCDIVISCGCGRQHV